MQRIPISFSALWLFVLSLGLYSCGDNFDETQTTIINGDPTALDSTIVSGRVIEEESLQPISQAELTIWQDGQQWSILSDDQGFYRFALPKDGSRVNIKFASDGLVEWVTVIDLTEPVIEVNASLPTPKALLQPGSSPLVNQDLFLVEGRVLDPNGVPVPDLYLHISGSISAYAYTDDSGHFSMATKPFDSFELLAIWSPCEINDFSGIAFPEGVQADVNLGDITTDYPKPESRTFVGQVLSGNTGEPVDNGSIRFNLLNTFPAYVDSEEFQDGSYEFQGNVCESHRYYNVRVTSDQGFQEFIGLPLSEGNIDRDFYVAGETPTAPSQLQVEAGGNSYDFSYSSAQYDDQQRWIITAFDFPASAGHACTFGFTAPADGTGEYDADWFTAYPSGAPGGPGSEFSLIPEDEDGFSVTVNISQNANGMVQGTFSGTVKDNDGNPASVSGSFDSQLLNQ